MALAPFFDKAALAAAAVLQGFDREEFESVLNQHTIGVRFDDAAASSFEGRVCLELAVNLLARLYPRLALIGKGDAANRLTAELRGLASSINHKIEIPEDAGSVTTWLVVGRSDPVTDAPAIYVGSDGWLVRVSDTEPVAVGSSRNPLGAAAAACFGAANVFRIVFASQLPHGATDHEFCFSVLDLDPSAADPKNPALVPVELRPTHLVGVGAIGNACVWALARVSGLSGPLHVVDGERVDTTNPQRYVLSTGDDVGVDKVALAVREMERTGSTLEIHPHPLPWGHFLAAEKEHRARGLVAVALDSARDRIAVQASLPERILNAWTQPGDLGLSHHDFSGEQACLACLYLPDRAMCNEDQIVAEAIRLPEALMEVRHLLHTGGPIGEAMVQRIAAAWGAEPERLLPFAGRGVREFYTEAVCGGILLGLSAESGGGRGTEVPLAFQSALAGVLLAASIVRESAGLPAPAATKIVIDLLRPLGTCLGVPVAKHPSGQCICQDPDYQQVYRERLAGAV